MKRKTNIAIILTFVLILDCYNLYSQKKDFVYLNNPYLKVATVNSSQKSNTNEIAKYAIDLTKYLPEDFVKDASKDYTEYIQKGLDENKIVRMPNFPILVNDKGLNVKSGSRIVFQIESSLIMKPNSFETYGIMTLYNIEDVIIYSPVIIGDRNKHIGTKGEWGMGIFIKGSKRIQLIDSKISNCWGDGIYIGRGNNGGCENVKIINGVIDNCRRNGISITDGENIVISNPKISNTNGTLPMSGIDIEPNDNKSTIDNILILDPITFNNSNAGILIDLNLFPGLIKKNVGIKIENHIDNSSYIGLEIGWYNDFNKSLNSLSGSIDIINPEWGNNSRPLDVGDNRKGPKINFKNIKIENTNVNIQKIKQELSKKENVIVK